MVAWYVVYGETESASLYFSTFGVGVGVVVLRRGS